MSEAPPSLPGTLSRPDAQIIIDALNLRLHTVETKSSLEAWNAAPFTANWKNYEVGFAKCQYRKGADGRVYLRGLAQPTAIGTNNILTLPAGFRPSLAQGFACASGNGGGAVVLTRVDVRANGEVIPVTNFTGTTGEFYCFLDTISFYPE